jgi:hypothetical protein
MEITPKTWAIKNQSARLIAAKEDLRRAVHVADADVLTISKLNTAFYKLAPEVRSKYTADERSLQGKESGKSVASGGDANGRAKKQARAERMAGGKARARK